MHWFERQFGNRMARLLGDQTSGNLTNLTPIQIPNYSQRPKSEQVRFRTADNRSVVNLFERPNNAGIRTICSDLRQKFLSEIGMKIVPMFGFRTFRLV